MGPISNPVQQRLAEPRVWDYLGPFGKGQIRRQDHGCLLRPLGDDLEEELSAEIGHRHIADFVDGDQVVALPSGQNPPQLQLLFGFDQLVTRAPSARRR